MLAVLGALLGCLLACGRARGRAPHVSAAHLGHRGGYQELMHFDLNGVVLGGGARHRGHPRRRAVPGLAHRPAAAGRVPEEPVTGVDHESAHPPDPVRPAAQPHRRGTGGAPDRHRARGAGERALHRQAARARRSARPTGMDVANIFVVAERRFHAALRRQVLGAEDLAYLRSIPGRDRRHGHQRHPADRRRQLAERS